jgi:hypothetical protein
MSIDEIAKGIGQLDAADIEAEIDAAEKTLARLKLMLAVVKGGTVVPPKQKRKRRTAAEIAAEKEAKHVQIDKELDGDRETHP